MDMRRTENARNARMLKKKKKRRRIYTHTPDKLPYLLAVM
jgi:hypothetical protein